MTYTGGWRYKEWATADGTTRFVNAEGQKWVEYQRGRPVYTFEEQERQLSEDEIILYDASRDFHVVLLGAQSRYPNRAYVNDGEFEYLPGNGWTQLPAGTRELLTYRGTFTQ